MKVVIFEVCQKELSKFPKEVIEDLLDAIAKLKLGLNLSMPLSRAMSRLGIGAHELRFKDRSGIYRVFYLVKKKDGIYLVHAFKKKTPKTPVKNLNLAKKRMRSL